jgi:hypothetical protein
MGNTYNETVVKVLTTQVSVTGTVALTSEILYPIVKRETLKMSTLHSPFSFLAVHLLVETIGNGSSGRLIDDAEDHKDQLTCWDSNNCVCNLLTEVSFGSLLHLGQNHSADLLGSLKEEFSK